MPGSVEHPIEATALGGQLLLALPGIGDPRFEKAVIYVTQHTAEGAMGIVINNPAQGLSMQQLLEQVGVMIAPGLTMEMEVLRGGPVDQERGFILHSLDMKLKDTQVLASGYGLTTTLQGLREIASGHAPREALFALGCATWGPGQLDSELRAHAWLVLPADPQIIFALPPIQKWDAALTRFGINPGMLSDSHGTA